jgi:hypothetical protein
MPAPQAKLLAQLTKTNFIAKNIKIPMNWKSPGAQYQDAFAPADLSVPPNPPTCLFREATQHRMHVDAAKKMSDDYAAYIDAISDAICSGIDQWMKTAMITGVMINGPVGMLAPGNVMGQPLAPLILANAPKSSAQDLKYSNAIASAISAAWQTWQLGLSGVLSYPAFAAFPGPVAPPTPSIPMPLIAFASGGEALLSAAPLSAQMKANFADPAAPHVNELFDALANAFATVFQMFKLSTLVQNVLGTGPIPTFAPPIIPVGPVVGGVGTGAPGCIA